VHRLIRLLNVILYRVVEDEKSMNYMDSPKRFLLERIQSMRVRSVNPYYRIVIALDKRKEATLNELVQDLNSKPQNEHSRLENLIKIDVARREKRRRSDDSRSSAFQEFYYYLSSDISSEEIEEIKKLVDDSRNPSTQIVLTSDGKQQEEINNFNEVSETVEAKASKPSEDDSNQLSLKEKIQMRLSRLPEFDPRWPESAQQAWFQAIKRLEDMQ
jgi:hypothetical protein